MTPPEYQSGVNAVKKAEKGFHDLIMRLLESSYDGSTPFGPNTFERLMRPIVNDLFHGVGDYLETTATAYTLRQEFPND